MASPLKRFSITEGPGLRVLTSSNLVDIDELERELVARSSALPRAPRPEGAFTIAEYAARLDLPYTTARNHVMSSLRFGLIERVGVMGRGAVLYKRVKR